MKTVVAQYKAYVHQAFHFILNYQKDFPRVCLSKNDHQFFQFTIITN